MNSSINSFNETAKQFFTTDELTLDSLNDWYKRKYASNKMTFSSFEEFFQMLFYQYEMKHHKSVRDLFNHFDKNKDGLLDSEEFSQLSNQFLSCIFKPRSALILVDIQNDFISGSLAIRSFADDSSQDGNDIVEPVNTVLSRHMEKKNTGNVFNLVVYTYDWHPADHISFVDNVSLRKISETSEVKDAQEAKVLDKIRFVREGDSKVVEQVLWPKHCVQHSHGAALHKDLLVVKEAFHLLKGTSSDVDSYSAFGLNDPLAVTQLHDKLKSHSIDLLFICGLATDVCVAQTAQDAIKLGYRVVLLKDVCRGVIKQNIMSSFANLSQQNAFISTTKDIPYINSGLLRPAALAVSLINRIVNKHS